MVSKLTLAHAKVCCGFYCMIFFNDAPPACEILIVLSLSPYPIRATYNMDIYYVLYSQ